MEPQQPCYFHRPDGCTPACFLRISFLNPTREQIRQISRVTEFFRPSQLKAIFLACKKEETMPMVLESLHHDVLAWQTKPMKRVKRNNNLNESELTEVLKRSEDKKRIAELEKENEKLKLQLQASLDANKRSKELYDMMKEGSTELGIINKTVSDKYTKLRDMYSKHNRIVFEGMDKQEGTSRKKQRTTQA